MHFCKRSIRRRFCPTVRIGDLGLGGGAERRAMRNPSKGCDKRDYHTHHLLAWAFHVRPPQAKPPLIVNRTTTHDSRHRLSVARLGRYERPCLRGRADEPEQPFRPCVWLSVRHRGRSEPAFHRCRDHPQPLWAGHLRGPLSDPEPFCTVAPHVFGPKYEFIQGDTGDALNSIYEDYALLQLEYDEAAFANADEGYLYFNLPTE